MRAACGGARVLMGAAVVGGGGERAMRGRSNSGGGSPC
jgi:hypothetical protein